MASIDDQVKPVQDDTTIEDDTPFTIEGKFEDEVILMFDDGQKLFVSKTFLSLASPVFLKMFGLDFKEKQTGTVKLKGKNYEDMLEFLLYLHPNESRQISDDNVYNILSLAEEYGNNRTIRDCKEQLSEMIDKELNVVKQKTDEVERTKAVNAILKVLSIAVLYGYDAMEEKLITYLGKIGTNVYARPNFKQPHLKQNSLTKSFFNSGWATDEQSLTETRQLCTVEFDALPDKLKLKVLLERLHHVENNSIH